MLGPYTANEDGTISYKGNKLFTHIQNILSITLSIEEIEKRVEQFNSSVMWTNISKINHQIYKSVNEYFNEIGALFTLLPLTTRMISSPGAIYGKKAINYTTDTQPIKLNWFDLSKNAFLSESSQIYLELALVQKEVNHVYSIYNSFRKEKADATHLSEFHHIEYEGHVSQEENIKIAFRLMQKIVSDLIKNNLYDLKVFLTDKDIEELNKLSNQEELKIITFKEALDKLYEDTRDDKYKEFSLKYFDAWEEIKLTEIYKTIIGVKEFPLLEVPFYHAIVVGSDPKVANNLDIIWPGYREILGSGHRVRNEKELREKTKIFNLPEEDYEPYLQTRKYENYKSSSGFGLGWERFLQGLLKMPFIYSAAHFPRIDKTLLP